MANALQFEKDNVAQDWIPRVNEIPDDQPQGFEAVPVGGNAQEVTTDPWVKEILSALKITGKDVRNLAIRILNMSPNKLDVEQGRQFLLTYAGVKDPTEKKLRQQLLATSNPPNNSRTSSSAPTNPNSTQPKTRSGLSSWNSWNGDLGPGGES